MSEVDDGPQIDNEAAEFGQYLKDGASNNGLIGVASGPSDLSQRASDNGQSTVDVQQSNVERMLEVVIANLTILDQKVTWLIQNGSFTAQRVDGLARMLEGVQAMAASMPGGFGKRARQMMQEQEGQQANG